MRVLINALFLIPDRVGGSESYLRGLIQALADVDQKNQYILCLGPEATSTFEPANHRWRIITSPTPSSWRPGRLAVEQVWLPRVARELRADLIHSAGYTAPLLSDAVRVTTIHDMNYRRHPEDLSIAERAVYSALMPLVAIRSDRIVTVSEAARGDILRWTRATPSKVSVVYSGARTAWPGEPSEDRGRIAAVGVSEPFVLTVAASYPHKNLARLVKAFPLEKDSQPSVQLVVVGLRGRAHPAIEAASEGHRSLIKILGWVDDALLASLYRRSLGLAFPSLYEGFGLPVVEAMALGTAVLTSNFGAMAEVADGAAELVDPYSLESIRDGLRRLVFDEPRRKELRRRGLLRAREFTWQRSAAATLAVYSDALTAAA